MLLKKPLASAGLIRPMCGWRRTACIGLQSEGSKFCLTAFGLDLWSDVSNPPAQPTREEAERHFCERFMSFLRGESCSHVGVVRAQWLLLRVKVDRAKRRNRIRRRRTIFAADPDWPAVGLAAVAECHRPHYAGQPIGRRVDAGASRRSGRRADAGNFSRDSKRRGACASRSFIRDRLRRLRPHCCGTETATDELNTCSIF